VVNIDARMSRNFATRICRVAILLSFALGSGALHAVALENGKIWPTKPVRVVVGFAPGGVADVLGRFVTEKLAKYNGQPFVIDNRPGAGGNIGAGIVARANADGYQILFTPGSVLSMNPSLYAKVPFDTDSFAPVSLLADMPVVLVLHAKNPARTAGEFISAARREPGRVLFSSPGAGSSLHLAVELFQRVAGVSIQHIPYKGGGEALNAVLSGQATGMFANPIFVMSQIKAGSLKALAVAGSDRLPQLPEVPSTAEVGLKGFDISSWFGIVAPARTSRALVQQLSKQIAQALHEPDVQQRLTELEVRPVGSGPDAFADFLKKDREKWDHLIRAANIRLE
jgi:tripartite-type tricarboxylate transporter receptor subunit TctC